MGWITNVKFTGEVNIDGIKISEGMTTQIRWDMGIGSMTIDGQGKITHVENIYPYSMDDEHRAKFNEEMLTYTGILDANIGKLIFRNGQLVFLDFSYDECNALYVIEGRLWNDQRIDMDPISDDGIWRHRPKSMTEDHWSVFEAALIQARLDLVSDGESEFTDETKEEYRNRKDTLIDPYWK